MATLFALKLRHPGSIYLLRGNHECSEITVSAAAAAEAACLAEVPAAPPALAWLLARCRGLTTHPTAPTTPCNQVLFGFCGECQRRSTLAAWEAVMQVFDALPLAAVLNERVFLCHGGISPYMRYPRDVNTIRRPLVCAGAVVLALGRERRGQGAAVAEATACCRALPPAALLRRAACANRTHPPTLTLPLALSNIAAAQDVNPNGEGLLADLLWADPSPHVSGWVPNPRGVSYVFGLDVAQEWLRAHSLRAIVRAHMVQQNGYEVRRPGRGGAVGCCGLCGTRGGAPTSADHSHALTPCAPSPSSPSTAATQVLGSNEVMTVFSATNYRDSGAPRSCYVQAPDGCMPRRCRHEA